MPQQFTTMEEISLKKQARHRCQSIQTLRRSPRLLLAVRMGQVLPQQPLNCKEFAEMDLQNLSKKNSDIKRGHVTCVPQAPLRRSPRFLPCKMMEPETFSQKLTSSMKSIETQLGSSSISSKLKEAAFSRKTMATICRNQQNQSRSKFGVTFGKTLNGPRQSYEAGMEALETPKGFHCGNPRRQSLRLLGLAPVFTENMNKGIEDSNVNKMIGNSNFSNKVEDKKLADCKVVIMSRNMEMTSTATGARKKGKEPAIIAKSGSEINLKDDGESISCLMKRPFSRHMASSNDVMKRGVHSQMTNKKEEAVEMRTVCRGDLLAKSRIDNGFVIMKIANLHKEKKEKETDVGLETMIEKNKNDECHGSIAWSKEQEEALQNAYLLTKPSPQFWKKVSKMVPGKSAQECFDKIHNIVTPLSSRNRARKRKKSISPIVDFDLSSEIFNVSETKTGKIRRCKTKRLAAQKTVRHLLRKHCLTNQMKTADHFSLFESSAFNIAPNASDIPTPMCTSSSYHLPQQPCERLSANSKMLSSFKLFTSPSSPSPEVLKQIKNRALHDRYIDLLHQREARRAMLSKKSNLHDVGSDKHCSKAEHGAAEAARISLLTDAKFFIGHFQNNMADPTHDLDADYSDEYHDTDDDAEIDDFDR